MSIDIKETGTLSPFWAKRRIKDEHLKMLLKKCKLKSSHLFHLFIIILLLFYNYYYYCYYYYFIMIIIIIIKIKLEDCSGLHLTCRSSALPRVSQSLQPSLCCRGSLSAD